MNHSPNTNQQHYSGFQSACKTFLFAALFLLFNSVAIIAAPLSGLYTVGGTDPHFETIGEATNMLVTEGVSGPVVISIRPGVYNETIGVPDISGASAVNTITFQSETGIASDVVVQNFPGAGGLGVWQVSGDYITIQFITIQQNPAVFDTYQRVLEITGDVNHVNVLYNHLIGTTWNTTIQDRYAVVFNWKTSTYGSDDILIEGNEIRNGSVGIYWGGSSLFEGSGLQIKNNKVLDWGINGIQILREPGVVVEGNEISSSSVYLTYPYGLLLEYCMGAVSIQKNTIQTPYYIGLQLRNCIASAANPGIIANNMVQVGNNSTTIGFGLHESEYQNADHNTVLISGHFASDVAISVYYGAHNNLRNNIAMTDTVGACIKLTYWPLINVDIMDYNMLASSSGTVGITSTFTQHATLADWQLATGMATHSIESLPAFVASDDLHLIGGSAGIDMALGGLVTDDIDYALRPAMPDMGADEQGQTACTWTAGIIDSDCPGATGTIDLLNLSGQAPFTYAWADGPTTEDRHNLAAGTYSVTITDAGACSWTGSFDVLCGVGGSELQITGTVTPVKCFNSCDGIIEMSVFGGCPPYNWYVKSPGSGGWTASSGIENSLCGNASYLFGVVDQCGAMDTMSFDLAEPTPIVPSLISRDNPKCNGGNDGSFEVSISGGTPPYEYSSNGGFTFQPSGYWDGLNANTYAVVARDANECSISGNIKLKNPPVLTLSPLSIVDESAPGAADGSITVQSSGGVGDHEYQIDGMGWQSSPFFGGLTAGTYLAEVQDEVSCNTTTSITVGSALRLANSGFDSPVLYPNPASDRVTIQTNLIAEDNIVIEILNAAGQLMQTMNSIKPEAGTIDLNLVDLPDGLYQVRLTTSEQTVVLPLSIHH